MPTRSPLYESDFFAWSREPAELLRKGELARPTSGVSPRKSTSIGRTEKRELVSRLDVLLCVS